MNKRFPTLDACLRYVEGLQRAGVAFQTSRVFADRFKASMRNRHLAFLGVERKAAAECEKLATGGSWCVEVEPPGSVYARVGIFGPHEVKTSRYRCAAWYDRYLPYAWAMIRGEHGYRCLGIDYESVNAYYATVGGFVTIGLDDDPHWSRIVAPDSALYRRIYDASMEIAAPGLPFEEAFNPALAFVAARRPDLFAKHTDPSNWQWQHACAVLEALDLPRPVYKKRRRVA